VESARRRARLVELYLAAWFAIELLAVACTMNTTLFDSMSGRADERVVSRARMIVLGAINYVELAVCFGLFYAMWWTGLHGAGQPVTAFSFSAVPQLTIGYAHWLVEGTCGGTGVHRCPVLGCLCGPVCGFNASVYRHHRVQQGCPTGASNGRRKR